MNQKTLDCPRCGAWLEPGQCCDDSECPLHPDRVAKTGLAPFKRDGGLYPHQSKGIEEVLDHFRAGRRTVVVCSPTGGGKGHMIIELARRAAGKGSTVGILTHRNLLFERIAGDLADEGIKHYEYAAGSGRRVAKGEIAVISMPTAVRRVESGDFGWPDFDALIVDESRLLRKGKRGELISRYADAGAYVVGFDATPVGCGTLYKAMVTAGDNDGLADAGLLVRGENYMLEVPNLTSVKRNQDGEFRQTDVDRVFSPVIHEMFGCVWENFKALNSHRKPTVLFGHSVGGSAFMAERLNDAAGYSIAAHIDAETPSDERQDVLRRVVDPADPLKVVCNYALLDCGVNVPGLEHGILLRPFGAASNYIQAVGRLKRAAEDKSRYVIQDHGGNCWRWGHSDTNWEWRLHSDPRRALVLGKGDKKKKKVACPKCGFIRQGGSRCPKCNAVMVRRALTTVIEHNGTLVKMYVPEESAPKEKKKKTIDQIWRSELIAAAHTGRTVKKARDMLRWRHKLEAPFDGIAYEPGNQRALVVDAYPWTKKIISKYRG